MVPSPLSLEYGQKFCQFFFPSPHPLDRPFPRPLLTQKNPNVPHAHAKTSSSNLLSSSLGARFQLKSGLQTTHCRSFHGETRRHAASSTLPCEGHQTPLHLGSSHVKVEGENQKMTDSQPKEKGCMPHNKRLLLLGGSLRCPLFRIFLQPVSTGHTAAQHPSHSIVVLVHLLVLEILDARRGVLLDVGTEVVDDQSEVLLQHRHPVRVNSRQVHGLEELDHESLCGLLQRQQRSGLPSRVTVPLLANFPNQFLEWQPAQQHVRRALILLDHSVKEVRRGARCPRTPLHHLSGDAPSLRCRAPTPRLPPRPFLTCVTPRARVSAVRNVRGVLSLSTLCTLRLFLRT